MEPNYGLVDLTTLSDLGISEREDSFSSMTSAVKYSVLDTAPLAIGWPLVWRIPTWRSFIQPNQTNTNFIFMKAVSSASICQLWQMVCV